MLIDSMSVSGGAFIADRGDAFGRTAPYQEQFRFHIAQIRELGGYLCGHGLYETMLMWETDRSLRDSELGATFADVWCVAPMLEVTTRPRRAAVIHAFNDKAALLGPVCRCRDYL